MRKILRNYGFLLTLAALIIALDQYTKMLVRTHLALEEYWSPWPWLEPYVRIVHWKNTGAAFGMLQGFGDVFTVLAFLVAIAIIYYFPQVPRQDWVLRLAMGLQLGGAVGNLIDRLTQGHVTDFISVGTFPVFNIADASISTGVAVLVLGMWFKERQNQPADPGEPDPDSLAESGAHVASGAHAEPHSHIETGEHGVHAAPAATDAHVATGPEEAKGE